MSVETFHRAGQHVQSAHGRRAHLASDGSHLQGGMIALMPTAADAKRLAVGGGEKASELHLTLMFLGDDMSTWDDHAKDELVANLTSLSRELDGPITAKIFGVSRWNGKGDSPTWVWNVGHGNDGDSHALQTAHTLAIMALEHGHDHPDIPAQYEPWQPHICAAYTKESGLLKTLEQRLGEVTFDRLRVSFGDEDHDIPLESGLTAAAALRREPTPVEIQCGADFAGIHDDWERARDTTAAALEPVLAEWRASLRAQVMAHTAKDDPEALPELRVDTLKAEDLLRRAMLLHARRAGEACQREAESQGVTVPEWHLPEDEDAVTAAVGGRRLISSIAKATSDLMASTIVQSAKRKFSTLFHTAGSPEEIADQVDEVLAEDPGVQAAVGTAMSTAQNVGRQAVLEAAPPAQYYASEILDRNTCAPCKEVDGEDFETLALAIKAYPVMGYKDCVGPKYGNACRGLIVARWTAEPPAVVAHGDKSNPGYPLLHPGYAERAGEHSTLVRGSEANRQDKDDPLAYYTDTDRDDDQAEQDYDDESLFADYSSDGYSDEMATYLRTGEPDEDGVFDQDDLDKMRDAMDRIAERNVLAEPVSVFRIAPGDVYGDKQDGDTVHDDAFMSTTVYQAVTELYRGSEDDAVIRIDLPAGMHVIPHRHLNPFASAKGEVILPRGMTLRRKGTDGDVIVYEPVYSSRGAEDVVDDPTSGVLDDAVESGEEGGETAAAYHRPSETSGRPAGEEAVPVSTTVEELGGKPNPGTKKDKRLGENDPDKSKGKKMTLGEALEAELAAKAAAAPATDGTMTTASWKGPLCVEGKVTGDGREFCPGALTWADLPIPLRWNRVDSHGGEARTEAVNVGRIDKIYRDGDLIMGEGVLDLSDEDGRRVHGKIKNKMLRGVSIDADSISDADVEYVMPEDMPADMDAIDMLFMQPEKVVFNAGRIRAATLCDIPAFAEAYIEMTDEDGTIVASAADGAVILAEREVYVRGIDGLIAHGGPEWKPPAAWFADPKLSLPTGITVTDEGRVYGHAAMWGTCHIGHTDVCIQPPHEEIHPYYMTGEVTTAEGTPVSVGQITVGTGHASLSVGAQAAAEHYDHTGHAVADVAVGNDAHGIWIAGSIRPGADPKLIHELRAAGQVSGDWRRIGGKLRLVGLLAVNIPGFPVPKTSARVASGAQVALVAAGRPTVYHGQTGQDSETVPNLREQMARLYDEVHGKE